ncbi:MAG: CDP-alcohol phosphatidyltransferase family protein [Candidatus Woesearchaeota archaeon]|nr:MAG: CDP-alcohol phosphatidyltransferase family protein [Candidatus Woesearchaeota archaeon]
MGKGALSLSVRMYTRVAAFRTKLFAPLSFIVTKLHITPNHLTLLGILFFLLFACFARTRPTIALLFLIIGYLLDLMDGSLARYQNVTSDRGKFIDMVADSLNFTLFTIGLVFANLLSGFIGMIAVYVMAASKLFRSIYHAQLLPSSWRFHAVAGTVPNIFVGLGYLSFLFYVLTSTLVFFELYLLLVFMLAIDALLFFFRILKN